MKKLLSTLFALILSICFSCIANASDIEGLYDNYQAVYLPSTNSWSTGAMADDRIVLTKKTTQGSGSYSEYYYSNGELAIASDSNFEFIKDGKLIAVDNAGLKYYEIVYKDGKFQEIPICTKKLSKIFPEAKIVKISEFKNNQYTAKKELFKTQEILLVNDTDKYFHKYTYSPSSVQKTDIKGLVTLSKYGKVKFSLYGDKANMLTIKVKKGSYGIECACSKECTCAKECKCPSECKCSEKCTCHKECKCSKECTCGNECKCRETGKKCSETCGCK